MLCSNRQTPPPQGLSPRPWTKPGFPPECLISFSASSLKSKPMVQTIQPHYPRSMSFVFCFLSPYPFNSGSNASGPQGWSRSHPFTLSRTFLKDLTLVFTHLCLQGSGFIVKQNEKSYLLSIQLSETLEVLTLSYHSFVKQIDNKTDSHLLWHKKERFALGYLSHGQTLSFHNEK